MEKKAELLIVVPPASPRGLTRRAMLQNVLAGLGAILAGPLEAHPMCRHLKDPTILEVADEKISASDWKPEFLDSAQNDALVAIADRMVPGSSTAQVNRVIDVLLTVETAENRKKFAAALAALDLESAKRFNHPVSDLAAPQLDELLSTCCAQAPNLSMSNDPATSAAANPKNLATTQPNLRDHFENLKGWIVPVYYASEQGMRELDWTDEFYFDSPSECPHPEGHQ